MRRRPRRALLRPQVAVPVILLVAVHATAERSDDPAPADPEPEKTEAPESDLVPMDMDVPILKRPPEASGKSETEFTGQFRTRDDRSKPFWKWEHLTGDWGNRRPWLLKHGIMPELVYTVEMFSNVSGGVETGTRVLGNLDLTLTLDTDMLGWWNDGLLFFYFENLVGDTKGINPLLGDPVNEVSNLNAGSSFARLQAYYVIQHFLDNRLSFKFGKQDGNADFVTSEISGEFINAGFSPPPNIPLPTFPAPSLAFTAFGRPLPWLGISAGVYGADPQDKNFDAGGLFSGKVFVILELSFQRSLAEREGTLRMGAWYTNQTTNEIGPVVDDRLFDSTHGAYILYDQNVWPEGPGPQRDQGLHAFAQLSWAPEAGGSEIEFWVGGGIRYTGAIPTRDRDKVALGVAYAQPSSLVEPLGFSPETLIETFYEVEVTPWLHLQPDLQYFFNPGGAADNAFAIGLRTDIVF